MSTYLHSPVGCFCPIWSSRAYTDHISFPSHAPYTHTADLWWPHHTLPGGTPGSPWLQQGYSYTLQINQTIKINQYGVNQFRARKQLHKEQKNRFLRIWWQLIYLIWFTVNPQFTQDTFTHGVVVESLLTLATAQTIKGQATITLSTQLLTGLSVRSVPVTVTGWNTIGTLDAPIQSNNQRCSMLYM